MEGKGVQICFINSKFKENSRLDLLCKMEVGLGRLLRIYLSGF